jgi:hypothetical protein
MSGIRAAENALRALFARHGHDKEHDYDPAGVIENERWWYLPPTPGYVGCAGYIVNKTDLYVNCLDSGFYLEDWFWAHDHGVFCDLVDFTFAPETKRKLVEKLLSNFQHAFPNAHGVSTDDPGFYRESEIPDAIARQFPTFRRHWVWRAIPDLLKAWDRRGLRFTSVLSASE